MQRSPTPPRANQQAAILDLRAGDRAAPVAAADQRRRRPRAPVDKARNNATVATTLA
jgi:hypothetical protein